MDESYLVVSDVHLGSKDCCTEEFGHFLDWLAGDDGALSVQTQGGTRTLSPPTTLILLGDMVELWIPRGYERSSVLCDSSPIFSKLVDLPFKKVYVLGNHDAELCDRECEMGGPRDTSFRALIEWACANDSRFEVVPRHYPNCPDDARKQRVRLGEKDYLFVHGQQFDPAFNASRGFVRFVPFLAALASAFDLFPGAGPIFFVLSLVLLGLFFIAPSASLAIDPLWFLALFVLAAYPGLSWIIVRLFTPAWEFKKSLSAVVALAGQSQHDVLSAPVDVSTRVDAFKRAVYEMKRQQDRPKYKHINAIVSEGYYRFEKDLSKPDVIVFGHTHVPEICRPMPVGRENGLPAMRQFVNSGMWLRPPEPRADEPATARGDGRTNGVHAREGPVYNTFVYIDRDGPILFRWCDRERTAEEIPVNDCTQ
jgi:UDP-2,3-diacylglucosamine pyrophosphatase LpxH